MVATSSNPIGTQLLGKTIGSFVVQHIGKSSSPPLLLSYRIIDLSAPVKNDTAPAKNDSAPYAMLYQHRSHHLDER